MCCTDWSIEHNKREFITFVHENYLCGIERVGTLAKSKILTFK